MFVFHPVQLSNPYLIDQPIVYKLFDQSTPTAPTTSNAGAQTEKPANSNNESSNGTKQVIEMPSTLSKHVASREIEHRFTETKDSYQIMLDVPGVKLSDLAIEIVNGNIVKVTAQRKMIDGKVLNYQQNFRINKKHVSDLSEAKAELIDGVLTIEMIKAKPTESKVIEIITSDLPENLHQTSNHFLVTFDLPGVKNTDVETKYHDGTISIVANRKRGNNIIKIAKSYSINEDKYDVQNIKAYLVDGVFTLYAPRIEKTVAANDAKSEQQNGVQKIVVSIPNSVNAAVSTTTMGDDDTVVVEHSSDEKSK